MATIYIDNKPYEVRDGLNLLQAILELGINLPYFCWHPAMGSVGACRQCAIKQFKDEKDTHGRVVMACMTPAADNTRISVMDPEVLEFRAGIIEWMMVNHPHDCPVCDEGGECHLQDMTVMTGHDYRRYSGDKRSFRNQNLGPFITHEMNRCIQCYRCVRFYRDVADGRDFNAFVLHDTVFFGRAADGTLESEFSGNLVEVCPTGVFDDKTLYKHYTRKWDLQTAPSICVNCSVGCNTIPGERYGSLRRIRNRYNGDVNGYFLCDRGRYGYEFVNAERRVREARIPGAAGPIAKDEAIRRLGELLLAPDGAPLRMIGIGSPRASLESNFALRALVGPENFYQGLPENERRLVAQIIDALRRGPARSASLADVGTSDAVLVLGEDVSNTAPMLALALRSSVRQVRYREAAKQKIPSWDNYPVRLATEGMKGPLFIATPAATRVDDIATGIYRAAPDHIARLGFAVAHELDNSLPEVGDLAEELKAMVEGIAEALKGAERPLVLSGASLNSPAIIQAAAMIAAALSKPDHPAGLCYALPECNSMGLGLMGGESLDAAVQAAQDGPVDLLFVLENDLSRRAGPQQLDALFGAARHVVVLNSLENDTTARGEVVLPAGTFAEADGTLVNNEGRAQRFYQVFVPQVPILESWRWIVNVLMPALGRPEADQWHNLDEVMAAMAEALPVFAPVLEIAPPATYRMAGAKIPREPERYSGRTAMYANISVHEPQPPNDVDSPLSFSMEGAPLNPPRQPPPALIPRFWAPGWNSIQSLNKFQEEIAGPLRGGNPGCRLIEPSSQGGAGGQQAAPPQVPAGTQVNPDEWLAVRLYHIYGSDELSLYTPGIVEQAPPPYIGLNLADAAALMGVAVLAGNPQELNAMDWLANADVELSVDGTAIRLPGRIVPGLPRGLVGVPALPGIPFVVLPARVKLAAVPHTGAGGEK